MGISQFVGGDLGNGELEIWCTHRPKYNDNIRYAMVLSTSSVIINRKFHSIVHNELRTLWVMHAEYSDRFGSGDTTIVGDTSYILIILQQFVYSLVKSFFVGTQDL